ncbi:MAG: PAS domain-containing protein, partial [Opitutaceae bacterium]
MPEALALLGRATGVSRVYIFDVAESAAGGKIVSQRFEWVAEGVTPQIDVPELQGLDLIEAGFERWGADLAAGRAVFGDVEDFPASERPLLEMQQILSILIQPIFAGDRWWGFMGFDACSTRQEWSRVEVDTLRIAARTISGAIHQQDRETEMRRRVELLSEAVIDTGPDGAIRYVNAAWRNLLGSEPQSAIGRPLGDFVHAEDTGVLERTIDEAQRAGGPARGELRLRRADGTGCTVVLAVTPLPHGGL